MTLPNVENLDLEGATGNQPGVSPETGKSIAGAPQSSQEFLQLKQNQDRLEKELKGLQSRQDKDKNEVQRFMDEVKGHVAKGKSLEEAEQAVYADRKVAEKDDLLNQIAARLGIGNSLQNVAGNNSNVADEVAKVFAEYQINPNDPEATTLLNLQGVDLVKAVSKLAIKRASTQPSDSSEATAVKGVPPPPAGIEGLTKEYQKNMLAARGNKAELARVKAKAIKDGVPVDTIAFV